MLVLFWGCLLGGILFALVTVLLSDIVGAVLHSFSPTSIPILQPVAYMGAITIFGGVGIILSLTTELSSTTIFMISLASGVVSLFLLYYLFAKPMQHVENSSGFHMRDLIGKQGEVSVTIPAHGYGEVILLTTGGHTNQIAASLEGVEIPQGSIVTVIEIRDHILWVTLS